MEMYWNKIIFNQPIKSNHIRFSHNIYKAYPYVNKHKKLPRTWLDPTVRMHHHLIADLRVPHCGLSRRQPLPVVFIASKLGPPTLATSRINPCSFTVATAWASLTLSSTRSTLMWRLVVSIPPSRSTILIPVTVRVILEEVEVIECQVMENWKI